MGRLLTWAMIGIVSLIVTTGCTSGPDDVVFKWAMEQQYPVCGLEGYCKVDDYTIVNSWSKVDADNEEHHYFDYSADFVRTPNKNGLVYQGVDESFKRQGTLDLVQRGNKWVAF